MSSENQEQTVTFPAGKTKLEGTLGMPADPIGIVLFAHGSGSSRFSPRNRLVADVLREARLATLLLDLLTPHEELVDAATGEHRFNIGLLAERLVAAIDWLHQARRVLPIGLFGASTGAAAALVAAARAPADVAAVVSRGGRPDLAGPDLEAVRAATLLIVGGEDRVVLQLNRNAMQPMRAPVKLEIIPGATHLFEERGALDSVAVLARDWLVEHLTTVPVIRS